MANLWARLSNVGIEHFKGNETLQRKVVLANQLGILGGGICLLTIGTSAVLSTVGSPWPILMIVLNLLLLPVLNSLGFVRLSRISIAVATPILFLMGTLHVKLYDPHGLSFMYFFVPRYSILAALLCTVVLIDIRERKAMAAGMLANFLCLALFDPIHNYLGIGIDTAEPVIRNYTMATIMSLAAFFFLSLGYLFLQQLSKHHEDSLRLSNENLQASEEEIKQNMEELSAIHESLEAQHSLIKKQQLELEHKNNALVQSLTYARRLQKGLLPSEQKFKSVFPESFILEMPRDIVSGDFYWVANLGQYKVLVLADCTGHGSSAALMTIAGATLLNEIVAVKRTHSPLKVIELLDEQLTATLQGQGIYDGMDVCVVCVDTEARCMKFAGAHASVYLSDGRQIQYIRGGAFPIGEALHQRKKAFTEHVFPIDDSSKLYLASDGYQDQFDEQDKRKFYRSNFRQLLEDASHIASFNEQKALLAQRFLNWKGNNRQTDDVLVIGLKLL